MGLDMYLDRNVYIGGEYAHREVKGVVDITIGGEPCPIDLRRVSAIVERVGYWRKANQIHRWFVENVQGGKDDCTEHDVELEQLRVLRDLCAKALETKNHLLLPPQAGFFFGGTDIDDNYWGDLRHTIGIIDALPKAAGEYHYTYRSSW